MKIRRIAVMAILATAGLLPMSAQKISDMTLAVLESYNELLAENPNDYATLLDRATIYYNLGQYDKAIADLEKGVSVVPAKDADMLTRFWTLYADACMETGNYEKALEGIDKALAATPDSYANIYKKGDILMLLNRPEEAYRSYSRLQQFKSRSQEAYFGMAKACVAMGQGDEAAALIKEAENAAPNSALTYCRIGDIYMQMNEASGAAAAYLNAFLLAKDNELARPLQSMRKLANVNFPAVAQTIDYAIGKTTNTLPLYFLKASMAQDSGNHAIAYDAYTELLKNPDARDASIYASQARCALMAGKSEEAIKAADNAIALQPSVDALEIKAYTDLLNKKPAEALEYAGKAAVADPNNVEPLILQALANIELEKYEEAIVPLNEAVMVFGDNKVPILIRGWIYKNRLGKPENSISDFNRVARGDDSTFENLFYKSLAEAWNGNQSAADKAIHDALEANPTKRNLELAVAYYTAMGNLQALSRLRESAGSLADFNAANPEFTWLSILMK